MKHIKQLIAWYDQYIMELIAGFMIVFIPLYPKWPIFDALPGYIVRVRLEDFLVFFALLLWGIQVYRHKIKPSNNPIFKLILIYLGIGFLSCLSAMFITRTVPLEPVHVGKLLLHWLRRVEYMSLAFIFFEAIKSKQSLKRLLLILTTTILISGVYGFGQKYFAWPVYSTMNREFSKGWRLVLTQNARVSSTFAGHYDFAAFNVIALSLLASLTIFLNKRLKPVTSAIFIVAFAMLLLTASRSSFIAYIGSVTLVTMLSAFRIPKRKALKYWIILMLVSGVGIRSFGSLYSRFAHLLMFDRVEIYISKITEQIKPDRGRDLAISSDLALVYTPSDTPPSPAVTPKPTPDSGLPPDVFEAIPESFPEASLSAIPQTSGGSGLEGKPRQYSDSAYTFGLSSAIRFDALWPKALAGFKRNPLLGSGYSTLLKDQVTDFTEAESTDNDYLRALGETGLLGLLSYYGIFAYILYHAMHKLRQFQDPIVFSFVIAFIAGLAGLLVNALYIDIFEASKIAYTIWGLTGAMAAILILSQNKKNKL